MILAIDPGNTHAALVRLDERRIYGHDYLPNDEALKVVRSCSCDLIAIEMIACYGMPVGVEVFDTCRWIGRYEQIAPAPVRLVYRKEVKIHLCNSMKANDASIRQALIDRYGPGKVAAIGTKKSPGPLYGFHGDEWAALAIGVTALRT